MQSYPVLIADRAVHSTQRDDVINPATGQPVATCARATAARVVEAVAAAACASRTCYNVFDAASPFGGYKQSGFGREMGKAALELYTQTKSAWVNLGAAT